MMRLPGNQAAENHSIHRFAISKMSRRWRGNSDNSIQPVNEDEQRVIDALRDEEQDAPDAPEVQEEVVVRLFQQ